VLRRLAAVVLVTVTAGVSAGTATAEHGVIYTTASGERVRVIASDGYEVDDARDQTWAEFLSSLVHGVELASVTLFLAPPAELAEVCGLAAIACYDRRDHTIYAVGEPFADVSAEGVIAHEYGHHVAASRSNTPWAAVDWGTKRWATYASICARSAAGELSPGARNERYELSPAEAFAEAYRVLNERRLGLPETAWDIVDERFIPDESTLRLLEQDVTTPWVSATIVTRTGRAVRGATAAVKVQTPLDGRFATTVRSTTPIQVELVQAGRVVTRKTGRVVALQTTVCGTRTASVRVRGVTAAARYTVTIARP
jgi:hypothetical protein